MPGQDDLLLCFEVLMQFVWRNAAASYVRRIAAKEDFWNRVLVGSPPAECKGLSTRSISYWVRLRLLGVGVSFWSVATAARARFWLYRRQKKDVATLLLMFSLEIMLQTDCPVLAPVSDCQWSWYSGLPLGRTQKH